LKLTKSLNSQHPIKDNKEEDEESSGSDIAIRQEEIVPMRRSVGYISSFASKSKEPVKIY